MGSESLQFPEASVRLELSEVALEAMVKRTGKVFWGGGFRGSLLVDVVEGRSEVAA
jgi:hypothetical protein